MNLGKVTICFLLFLSVQPPLSSSQDPVSQYFDEGNAAIKGQRYDQAIASYTKIIQRDPDSAIAYAQRAYAYICKELFDWAVAVRAMYLLEAAEDHFASIKSLHSENRVTQNEKTTIASQLEPWQTSVPEFVKEIQRLYSQGASEEELTKRFNGKEVHWQGRVIGTEKPVRVRLGDYSINLQNGRVATLDDMVLFGPNFAPPANTVIRFRVTLMREDKDFPFPPIRVADKVNEQDRSTRIVVWVDAEHDAALE